MSVKQLNLEMKEAETLLIALGDINAQLKPLEKQADDVKKQLKSWAEKNRKLFDGESSLAFDHGTLTFQQRMEAEYGESWNPSDLAKKAPQLLQLKATEARKEAEKNSKIGDLIVKSGVSFVAKETFLAKAK